MFGTARRRVLWRMAGGVTAIGVPTAAWWYTARQRRAAVAEDFRTKIRIPGSQEILDQIIEDRCQAGDVILFDRRCENCAAGPWAALACLASKAVHCHKDKNEVLAVSEGNFDHIGVVVPGYVRNKADVWDPSNLLLLEATAGEGIVARPLKDRLEQSQARSIVLVPLQIPGERRNAIGETEVEKASMSAQALSAARTRAHLEKELAKFRDQWIDLGAKQNYRWMHSTLTLGGAAVAALGLQSYVEGPVSPSAWLALMALQQGAAATNLDIQQRNRIVPQDFLRYPSLQEERAVRLRPGWRLLAPIDVRSR